LHEEAGNAIVRERERAEFASIHDLARRVPELKKSELNTLADIGALNSVASCKLSVAGTSGLNAISSSPQRHGDTETNSVNATEAGFRNSVSNLHFDDISVSPCLRGENLFHRRDALWSVGAAANSCGPLLENISEPDTQSPLMRMTHEERLVADFRGTGMTVGPHPMAYHRERLQKMCVRTASELGALPSGRKVQIAGGVIARQRPGTAKGFVFLSLEDETGVSNAIVNPGLFQQNRLLLSREQFLLIEGILQNQDGVISVKASRVLPLHITRAQTTSHDFH
jgi:DNA polymerase III alpha subunit